MESRRHVVAVNAVSVLAGLALLMGLAGTAAADEAGLSEAETHFHNAQRSFDRGGFEEAASEFLAAYEAKALPELLFNVGACYEKLAKEDPAEIEHWRRAVEYYRRYLEEAPEAADRQEIEARIAVLEDERERIAAEAEATSEDEPGEVSPSPEVAALEEIGIRGLVVIESEPAGALIYLDDKRSQPLGRTPWSGTLEGEHTVYIERQGYKPLDRRIAPSPDKLLVLAFAMAEENKLGWIEVTANVPGADVYIDDKAAGVYRKTPFSGNLPPGKHELWITAEGYDEYYTELEVEAGEVYEVEASLEGTPVGYVDVRGQDIERASVYVDGELLCAHGPCREPVPEGEHEISVEREGYKPYRRTVEIEARSELRMNVRLVERPGRGDAVWAYVFAAAFLGGGAYLGLQAQGLEDDLEAEIAAGAPPPDSNDPRFLHGKLFALGADVGYLLGGLSLAAAIYYTFRDKGPSSVGTTQVKSLTMTPYLGPGHAGVGMEVRW